MEGRWKGDNEKPPCREAQYSHELNSASRGFQPIMKTRLYSVDPLKPYLYWVKLGFTRVYIIFLISAQKHRLWVLVRTASPRRFERIPTIYVVSRNMKNIRIFFYLKIFIFWWQNFQYIWIGLFSWCHDLIRVCCILAKPQGSSKI